MRRAIVSLPHGLLNRGSWLRKADLRELNGYDEERLAEDSDAPALQRARIMLTALVDFGDKSGLSNEELLSYLTIGDLTVLILHLRRMTFGNTLQCLLVCPACKEEMSTDLYVDRLLETPASEPSTSSVTKIGDFVLKLRPVTSADVDTGNEEGEMSEVERLVRMCVVSSEPPLPARLSDELLVEISSKLAELDRQADLILDLICPNCKNRFQVPFFPEDFFLREIDARKSQLEKEVHWLAFNYHWSEDAILSLPLIKRKRYVDMINKTLSGESV